MSKMILQIKNLHKNFEEVKAVNGIDLSINEGEMFGLVGPDGAGKTTTIRILCGLLKADEGSVEMFGMDISQNKKDIQNKIGYLSQKFSLYEDLSIDENIEFFAEIQGVRNFDARRNELLEFTRLIDFRKRPAGKLSGGMKQKLALACSLIHKPKILFLDEPTTGVDPVSRRDFWKILSGLQKDGIAIFMTTPYLDEAERCNRVALMHKGEILISDAPNQIKDSVNKTLLELTCAEPREAYKMLQNNLSNEIQLFGDRLNILIDDEKEVQKIVEILSQNNIGILEHRKITPSLENIFIYLVKNKDAKEFEQVEK